MCHHCVSLVILVENDKNSSDTTGFPVVAILHQSGDFGKNVEKLDFRRHQEQASFIYSHVTVKLVRLLKHFHETFNQIVKAIC